MRIAVIDDDEDLRFATSLALKSDGHVVHGFADCDSARSALERGNEVSVVLLDIHLDGGGMKAPDFVSWLRQHGFANTRVVVVSGVPDAARVAREIGANGHLTKPFNVSDLLRLVARCDEVPS